MLMHKPTKILFKDRKEAKMVMGQGRYRRLALRGEFEYIDPPKVNEK